jgi:hypothetical protein
MNKALFIFYMSAFLLFSCVESTDENVSLEPNADDAKLALSSEAINQIVKSVSSPLELTSMIKASGAKFDKEVLNNPSNASGYTNSYSKAINLGIYGADLGYINLYDKTYASMEYLSTIRNLAEDLNLGHFFDFETLKRLSSNSNKLDSIIFISTSSFEKMNNYLAKQKRDNISVMMLVGGWIESLHLATRVAKDLNHKELIDRIGEQKIALDQINLLMGFYKTDPAFATLSKDVEKLKMAFDKINITYEYQEPEVKEVDGMLVIEEKSSSKIDITQKQFEEISGLVSQIRNNLIKS